MNIEEINKILEDGKLAIIPTDTTYGIVCDATNEEAVKNVFIAKKRDFNKPLIILVSNFDMLKKYAAYISNLEEKIIKKYMPGKLSILIKKNNLINDLVTASSPYVAVRIPDNKELLDLINTFNKPIVATSANISGSDIITNVEDIESDLLNSIDYIYDGGILESTPSTLIKVENEKIIFLREGILTEQIKKDFKDYIKN